MPHTELHPLGLFDHDRRTVFLAYSDVPASGYDHSFGGNPSDCDLTFTGPAIPLHLLFRLDLSDPRIGIDIPGVRWLPLCYGFGFGGGHTAYLVRSDTLVETLEPVDKCFDPHFPYPDYPQSFPNHPLGLIEREYDPSDVDDALAFSAVFGLGGLSPASRTLAIARLEKHDFFEEVDAFEMTKDQFLDTCEYPFIQGPPESQCPNPDCATDSQDGAMVVFSLLDGDPVPDVSLFGDLGVQFIFQICLSCRCSRVSNQCT